MDLFGKRKEEQIRELQSRTIQLEKDKADLIETLQKRDEKIKRLSRDFQEAQVRCKEAESRIAARERFNQAGQDTESQEMAAASVQGGRVLGIREIQLLAERLDEMRLSRADLLSASLTEEGLADFADLPPPAQKLLSRVRPKRGAILFHCPHLFSLVLIPPFPVTRDQVSSGQGFNLKPLREILDTPVLMLSLHAGESVIGVSLSWQGFEALEVVKSQVMGRHSKGGWSQRRFERLREEDVKNHASEVLEALRPVLQRYRPLLRLAVVSGDSILVGMVEPEVQLPILQRRMEQHDYKKKAEMLDELYGFLSYIV
ncbi:MAG: peptide chain release factor 1 [Methanosaeta sp. PtaB.Bin039]|nr:MAG: peptide chain release factor 1 [Methanosaeta sp. PtaB.Bin039]HOT06920.1 Vms1/Ankzf1 family peptidyl-tRNA hydrolase [Methanotrichaceae archaeon]HQF16458.1 Vms1/Ankzf1 family peptidyl-tRNA hydrolase [Methanotrichaceae archaeon]HQI91881.1 Vms1/Ankzf1 family peptidyl-tRNA hydrolase [Methanotrichaceae archaeon]HQJ28438.1 Vms1/Ankzf1 family peptidyl-tRNA hydrolase [Methanotrichaceae archaeon]